MPVDTQALVGALHEFAAKHGADLDDRLKAGAELRKQTLAAGAAALKRAILQSPDPTVRALPAACDSRKAAEAIGAARRRAQAAPPAAVCRRSKRRPLGTPPHFARSWCAPCSRARAPA